MSAKTYGIIYKITNTVNGKVYIGQTKNKLADRWGEHRKRMSCRRLGFAIRKYGPNAFTIEQIAVAHSKAELNELEAHWIVALQSHLPAFGYNLTLGGHAPMESEETRLRKSEARKRYWSNPEARAKQSAVQQIAQNKPEAKAKMSEVLKRVTGTPEARARNSAALKVAKGTPEARAKQAEAMKRYYEAPEARQRTASAIKQALSTPESRTKLSASQKRRFADPDVRAATSVLRKATFNTPEIRKQRSEISKRHYEENPQARAKTGEAVSRAFADPERLAKRRALMSTPEYRAKQSAAQKASLRKRKEGRAEAPLDSE